jgi:bacterioferritin-associated ferredoxin
MKSTEKAIRDFCGHHADWWPSTTQVQEMLALAQPCPTCEALARTVMLDQTSHDTKRQWVGLTDEEIKSLPSWWPSYEDAPALIELVKNVEAKLKEKNGGSQI